MVDTDPIERFPEAKQTNRDYMAFVDRHRALKARVEELRQRQAPKATRGVLAAAMSLVYSDQSEEVADAADEAELKKACAELHLHDQAEPLWERRMTELRFKHSGAIANEKLPEAIADVHEFVTKTLPAILKFRLSESARRQWFEKRRLPFVHVIRPMPLPNDAGWDLANSGSDISCWLRECVRYNFVSAKEACAVLDGYLADATKLGYYNAAQVKTIRENVGHVLTH